VEAEPLELAVAPHSGAPPRLHQVRHEPRVLPEDVGVVVEPLPGPGPERDPVQRRLPGGEVPELGSWYTFSVAKNQFSAQGPP
jgi:hypothetical protein